MLRGPKGSKLVLIWDFIRPYRTGSPLCIFGSCIRYLFNTFFTFGSRLIYFVQTFLVGSCLISASEGLVSHKTPFGGLTKKCRSLVTFYSWNFSLQLQKQNFGESIKDFLNLLVTEEVIVKHVLQKLQLQLYHLAFLGINRVAQRVFHCPLM